MDKDAIIKKLENENLVWEDLPDAMNLLIETANSDEDFEEEYSDMTKSYQFSVTDKPENEWMWLKIESGKFSYGTGKLDKADLTFIQSSELAAGMVSGAVDSNSAYMKGDLKIEGSIGDGVKFQNILALFKDVLDI